MDINLNDLPEHIVEHAVLGVKSQAQLDTRYLLLSGSIASITTRDHHLLTGLTDDDHTIYPLLLGRAGGQTLKGGTAITDILKLQGTSGNGTLTSPAIQMLVGNAGATTALTILNNGNVGIGTTAPGAKLEVVGNVLVNAGRLSVGTTALNTNFVIEALSNETATTGEKRALSFVITGNPTDDWGETSILGLNGFADHQANFNALGSYFGGFFGARNSGTSTLWVSYGGFLEIQNTSTGTCDYAVACTASIKDTGGGNFTNAYGLISQAEVKASGTISNRYGVYIKDPTGTGAVTTNYGLYLENQSKGGTNYGIYTNSGANSLGGILLLRTIKSGATQAGAGAAANEIWKTASHVTLPDNVLMIGV